MLRIVPLLAGLIVASSAFGQTQFGYTNAGTSEFYLGPNQVRHCRFQMNAEAGTADSITCYVRFEGITDSLGVALYSDSAGNPTTLLTQCGARQISVSWSTRWYSFALADHVELQADRYYWLSFFASASSFLRCDDLGAGETDGHFADPWPPSNPATCNWTENDYTFSIYCTYSASGEAAPACRRRRVCGGSR
jgi:hypothetical protein